MFFNRDLTQSNLDYFRKHSELVWYFFWVGHVGVDEKIERKIITNVKGNIVFLCIHKQSYYTSTSG